MEDNTQNLNFNPPPAPGSPSVDESPMLKIDANGNTSVVSYETRAVTSLTPWDKNYRDITRDKLDNLKEKLQKHGQREPLLITPDGTILSGNMRYRAMVELGWENARVEIVDFVEENGIWYTVQNGERQSGQYTSKEAAMLEVGLTMNDVDGYYVLEDLDNLLSGIEIDTSLYGIQTESTQIIDELMQQIAPEDEKEKPEQTFKSEFQVVVDCKNEIEQQEVYDKLVSLGLTCKVLTL